EVEVVEERLWNIAGEEGMQVSQEEISKIAKAAHGDLRVALNFLQSGLPMPKDEEATAAQAIDGFFFASDRKEALRALRSYPGQPRDKIRDLFTAVVKSRVHEERKASALDALSKADIVMGRMLRGKDWRLLRYLDALLASELWAALGDGGPKYTADAVPWPLLVRIWNDSKKMKDIASAAGRRLGTSQRGFLVQDAPYVFTLCEGKSFRDAFVESLGLEENYAEFISKEAQRTARLQL
ncbi:MAG TPA: hypothetical protein VEB67_00090, partial [Nitrososphaerales archaeon]|nr:hypothetical protein [Nitrososphaerales archaeon]